MYINILTKILKLSLQINNPKASWATGHVKLQLETYVSETWFVCNIRLEVGPYRMSRLQVSTKNNSDETSSLV
jgi:hypothetical protein